MKIFYKFLMIFFMAMAGASTAFAGGGGESEGILPNLFHPKGADTDFVVNHLIGVFDRDAVPKNKLGGGSEFSTTISDQCNPGFSFKISKCDNEVFLGPRFYSLAIQHASHLYLMVLLTLGAVFMIYNVVMGAYNTAKMGKLLADKASLGLSAVRNVAGIAMLIPVAGYSAIQRLVFWMATNSVYAGDVIWEDFVSRGAKDTVKIAYNTQLDYSFLNNLRPMVLAHVCTKAMNMSNSSTAGASGAGNNVQLGVNALPPYKINGSTGGAISIPGVDAKTTTILSTVAFGNPRATLMNSVSQNESICGRFTLVSKEFEKNSTNQSGSFIEGFWEKLGQGEAIRADSYNELEKKRIAWFGQEFGKSGGTIDKIADEVMRSSYYSSSNSVNPDERIFNSISNAISKYRTAMFDLKNSATLIGGKFKADLDVSVGKGVELSGEVEIDTINANGKNMSYGVVEAGSYYWSLVGKAQEVSKLINRPLEMRVDFLPNYIGGKCQVGDESCAAINALSAKNGNIIAIMKNADTVLSRVLKLYDPSLIDENNETLIPFTKNKQGAYLIDMLASKPGGAIGIDEIKSLANINYGSQFTRDASVFKNPLVVLHSFGEKFLWWFDGLFTKLLQGQIGPGLTMMLIPLAMAMLIPAVTLMYYLPVLPFIIWMGAIFGWYVMFIQAVFGAPILAMAHLTMERDSFIGGQRQGYTLLLALAIKMPLMIIGFIISTAVITPLGYMVTLFYSVVATTLIGGKSLIYIIGILAVSITYVMILQNLVKRIFALSHAPADNILVWFGGSDNPMLGQYADGIEQGSGMGIQQMTGGISSVGSTIGMRGMPGRSSSIGGFGSGAPSATGSGSANAFASSGANTGVHSDKTSSTGGLGAHSGDMNSAMTSASANNGHSMASSIKDELNQMGGVEGLKGLGEQAEAGDNLESLWAGSFEKSLSESAFSHRPSINLEGGSGQGFPLTPSQIKAETESRNDVKSINNQWNALSKSERDDILARSDVQQALTAGVPAVAKTSAGRQITVPSTEMQQAAQNGYQNIDHNAWIRMGSQARASKSVALGKKVS